MRHPRVFMLVVWIMALCSSLVVRANPAHEQLSAMSEEQRRSVLAAFLIKSGEQCTSVSKTFFQGSDKEGNAVWNAACAGGASFVVQVNNNATGSTRILNCKVLKPVSGGTCFTKFKI